MVVRTLEYTSDLLLSAIFSGGIQFEIPCLGILIRHITMQESSKQLRQHDSTKAEGDFSNIF